MQTIEELTSDRLGGTAVLNLSPKIKTKASQAYATAIRQLERFDFWRESKNAEYRPEQGLWRPQRRAVAFAHAYLCASHQEAGVREAALIKMPTGTGKTAVIAALGCASPLLRKVLVVTPRASLVHQMKLDLAYRFWGRRLSALYYDCQLHEAVDEGEIARVSKRIDRGEIAPVRELTAGQYEKIYDERDQPRQILVSTFNALHLILGLEPPAHRSMYGRELRDPAESLRRLGDKRQDIGPGEQERNVEEFRNLLRSLDLIIVDEGHHEPAYSWAQTIRALARPTLIMSATPYRNDYKYFQIEGNYVFNLPWTEAVAEKLIREVKTLPPKAPRGAPRAPRPAASRSSYREVDFIREFSATLAALPSGKKAIVHAATFVALKSLQREFYAAGEEAVLIHDAFEGAEVQCPDLARVPTGMREALKNLRFQHVWQTKKSDAAQKSRIWLHQYKLLEGVDDDRFVEIWLYDGFGSARQLVQQVGRAIRRPDLSDRTGQVAILRGSSKPLDVYEGAPTVAEQLAIRWGDYLEYERYAAERTEIVFTAETQLLATLKRAAPEVQYIAGEFRGGHLLDQEPTMAAFHLPRRAVVCRVKGVTEHELGAISDAFMDSLAAKSREAMLLEERFDIRAVPAPSGRGFEDLRMIRYLAWSNSTLLTRHHIPEWRLGLMVMVRAGRYVFLLDTEGVCIDGVRLGLLSPESRELKRLFPAGSGGRTRIVETAARGLDISELGIRSLSVRKHALDEGYFDLAEASQVPTAVEGYGPLVDRTARRRLCFTRSSLSDATYKLISIADYIQWVRAIGDAIADERTNAHRYFARFAAEVPPLDKDQGAPQSILLDLWDLLQVSDETRDQRRWNQEAAEAILSLDTCCEVKEEADQDGKPRYWFKFGPYKLDLKYIYRNTIPASGRYALSGDELNSTLTGPDEEAPGEDPEDRLFGRQVSGSLTRLINQEQAFSIVPAEAGIVYSHSHFYKPEVNDAVLELLEPFGGSSEVVSEKGDTRVTRRGDWDQATYFGLIYGWLNGADAGTCEIAADLKGCDLVICDDGPKEAADFYGVDSNKRRVLVVHAKVADKTPGISARDLQEVTRQAQASLAFAGSARQGLALPNYWSQRWTVTLQDARGARVTKPRILSTPRMSAPKAHDRLIKALADPTYVKEIIVLTAGLLSASAAREAFKADPRRVRDLQFLYFLASVRTTFDRAGVRYRIVCNP